MLSGHSDTFGLQNHWQLHGQLDYSDLESLKRNTGRLPYIEDFLSICAPCDVVFGEAKYLHATKMPWNNCQMCEHL